MALVKYAIHVVLLELDFEDPEANTHVLEENEVVGARDEYDSYEEAKADYDKLKRRYQG